MAFYFSTTFHKLLKNPSKSFKDETLNKEDIKIIREKSWFGFYLLVIFLVLSITIGASGYFYYQSQANQFGEATNEQITGIADLKVKKLVYLGKERMDAATVILKKPLFVPFVHQWFEDPANPILKSEKTALTLPFPISPKNLPELMAGKDKTGIVEGIDYRGVPVVAAVRAIPNSPWFLVSKIDVDDANALLKRTIWSVVIIVGLLIAFIGSTCGLLWRLQRAQFYKTQYETEIQRAPLLNRIETMVREPHLPLELALQSAALGLWNWDIVDDRLYFDKQTCDLLGINSVTFIGLREDFFRVIHPDDREMIKAKLARTIEQDVLYESEYRVVWPDGSVHYVTSRGRLVRTGAGKPWSINGIIWDITERYRAEKEIGHLAQENAAVAEIGRIINSTLEIEEVYDRFAKEVKKLIPYDRLEITRSNFQDQTDNLVYVAGQVVSDPHKGERFPFAVALSEELSRRRSGILIQAAEEKELAKRFPAVAKIFRSGIQSMLSIPLLSHDQMVGGFHLESLKTDAYTEEDLKLAEKVGNQIAGAIANAQLFAEHEKSEKERKSLAEQFLHAQKMEAIGQLAGGVAHDFNNLLTVISIQIKLVLRGIREKDPLKENLKEIEKAADRAANLTRQLLAFSRRQILETKVINLNIILEDMEKMLERVIGEDIELKVNLTDDLGLVKVDPGQVEQVIVNLAVNAKDAMPQGGKLVLKTANTELDRGYASSHTGVIPGPYVMFSMTDTGIGMGKEVREQIFDPFFTTKEKGKGTGLGLSTVYGIVKQSGGHIAVYSEVNQGTSFKVYLPRVIEKDEGIIKTKQSEETPRGKETILVVEDEESVRNLAVKILRDQGYTVLDADQAEKGLLICEKYQKPINLILTDVVMPKMNGVNFIERLKQVGKYFKVIYMTGHTDETIVNGLLDKKVNLILKPFTLEKLARKVREVLDKD
jgi:PAS domain S-box-containing protein